MRKLLWQQVAATGDVGAIKAQFGKVSSAVRRMVAGTVDYLSVATVQATALADERAALALLGRRSD